MSDPLVASPMPGDDVLLTIRATVDPSGDYIVNGGRSAPFRVARYARAVVRVERCPSAGDTS